MQLKGTKTEEDLKAAFAGESKANRRYLYFANMADIEGAPEVANVFRNTAEGETGHAHGHMEYLIAGAQVILKPVLQLAMSLKHWSPQLQAKRTSTQTCTRVWQKQLAKKALMK